MFEHLFTTQVKGMNPQEEGTDRPLRGTILGGTKSVGTELYVFLETLGENARRGPCVWTPIIGPNGEILTPGGKEDCAISFDADGLPWIVAWVPNANTNVMSIQEAALANESVGTSKIKAAAITTAKIALEAVQTLEIGNLAVTTAKLAANAVTAAKIAAEAVGTAAIENGSVTPLKLSEPRPKFVSALPATPFDGQEIFYQNAAMAEQGTVWHLRYREASASTHKWEFVGGAPISSFVQSSTAALTTGSWALAGTSPAISSPLSGDYVSEFSASAYVEGTSNIVFYFGAKTGALPGAEYVYAESVGFWNPGTIANERVLLAKIGKLLSVVAGTSIAPAYTMSSGSETLHIVYCNFMLTPIRVG